jgi:arsenate-mycothiol transferase
MVNSKPSVLFVCVHNSGKSQTAAALMRAKAGDQIDVLSGGTDPGTELWGPAREAAAEIGASMDGEYPKTISDEVFMSVNRIVILGNAAKLEPRAGMLGSIETWLTPDPGPEVGDKLAQARIIRDDIARRVDELFKVLTKN